MNNSYRKSKFLNHPLHPIFTHFPMALLIVSLLWDIIGFVSGNPFWWSMSYWSIAVGLIFATFAIVTGFIDFAKIPQGHNAENVAMRHIIIVMVAVIMYTGSFFFRFGSQDLNGIHLIGALSFSVLGFIILMIGGWYGGELVYRHGIGRSDDHSSTSEK